MASETRRRRFLGSQPRRTLLIAPLIPIAAVALYAGLYVFLPGFSEHVRIGLSGFASNDERIVPPPFKGRITDVDGRRMLWAGSEPGEEFDITTFRLDPNGLHFGLGREAFQALIEPEFVTVDDAVYWAWFDDAASVLTVSINGEARIYPLFILRRHEVVNDVVGGQPIFAAYCVLAKLAAAYDRRLSDEQVLTFAVSGYTYADADVWDGRDAFVLWDRETESLWWPPIGRAVAGPLIDVPMQLVDQAHWAQMSWGEARRQFPDALVLKRNQSMDPPGQWPQLDVDEQAIARLGEKDEPTDGSVAPRWGANPNVRSSSRSTTQPTSQPN